MIMIRLSVKEGATQVHIEKMGDALDSWVDLAKECSPVRSDIIIAFANFANFAINVLIIANYAINVVIIANFAINIVIIANHRVQVTTTLR